MASVSLLIAGEQRITGESIPVFNPYTGEPIAEVSVAPPEVLRSAIDSAEEAAGLMRAMPSYRRSEILYEIANRIRGHAEELARLITLEAGKPIRFSRLEVDRAALTFTLAAEEAKRIPGEVLPLDLAPGTEHRTGLVRRYPVGVILGISPFNFPLNLVAHKVAPAIASGNSIIIKPSSATPLTALRLGEVALDAGLPAGALNVTPCRGIAAEAMLEDARIKMLTFTGSAAVGWRLKSVASKKKVTLELGGNAGVVIEDAQNLESVVQRLIVGSFAYAGQICIAVQRIFVNWKIYQDFEEMFVAATRSTPAGDPADDRTIVGPMIDTAAANRTMALIEGAQKSGAKLLCGGTRERNVILPAILTEAPADSEVCTEEVFAPVVTLEPYDDFEEALAKVNSSRYGLQAGVWTADIRKAMRAFDQLEVGGVIVNDFPTFRVDSMPYGGVKDSGFGREGVRYAIEEMTEPRLMVLNLS